MSSQAKIDIVLSNGQQAGKSLNELTAQSAKLAREIKKMEIGSDAYVKATEDYKQIATRLKDVKNETFNTAKAQDVLNSEMGQYIPFNSQLGKMVGTFKGLSGAIKGASISQRALNIAIAASGIGLIVIVLGKLVQSFLETQAGMDAVTKVTRPLFAIFERLKGLVQELGGSVFKGLGEILTGKVGAGLKTLATGALDAMKGVGGAITEGAKAGVELDKLQKQIEQTQNDMILSQSRLNREIAEQAELSKDTSKSEAERQAAAEKGIGLISQRVEEEDKLLQMQMKKLEIEQGLNDTNRQDNAEMNQLIAQREELIANAAKERVRFNAVVNKVEKQTEKEVTDNLKTEAESRLEALDKEKNDRIKFIEDSIAEEIKANEARKSLEGEMLEGFKAQRQEDFKNKLAQLETMNQAEQEMIDILFFENQVTQEERDAMLYEAQKKGMEARLALLLADGQQSTDEYQKIFMDLIKINFEHETQKTDQLKTEEEKRKAIRDQGFAAAAGIAGGLASILAESAKQSKTSLMIMKAAQTAEVGINTITEVSGIFSSTGGWGPAGWILAIGQAALATARGAMAINKINSVKTDSGKSFAKGGPVFGPSHQEGGIGFSMKGSPVRHEMEGNEIILAKGVYQSPTLRTMASELNVLGGGRSFALGGPVMRDNAPTMTNVVPSISTSGGLPVSSDSKAMEMNLNDIREYLATIAGATVMTAKKPTLALTEIQRGLAMLDDIKQDAAF